MIQNILNRGFLKDKLDILCVPIHERYESNLCKTGHNFWAWRGKQVKDWNSDFAPIPPNYYLLNPEKGEKQIPPHVDIDLVISGNKFGCFQIMGHYANKLDVPLISVEHTAPHPSWPQYQLDALKSMRGDINIFISEWSRRQWGWNEDEAIVIHHGIDTNVFRPLDLDKQSVILTTVNEYSKRDWCCGYNLYKEVTKDLPALNIGNDPPFSQPAKSIEDLVKHHNQSSVFLNTSTYSPFPMSVFEAMACEDIVVSLPTCMIPEVITHGVNGILVNNAIDMRSILVDILKNRSQYEYLGKNARKTILEKFSLEKFVSSWNGVFNGLYN